MNCHYCQQPCTLITPGGDYSGVDPKLIRWECQNGCRANFRFLKDGGLVSITWSRIIVNANEYFVKFYPGVTGNAPEFTISFYTTNDEGKHYWQEIIRWDFIPESWTPQNVAHKLKLYLIFL
jgi:hypothetical protein